MLLFKFSALLLLVDLRFGKQQCLLYCMEHNMLPCQFQWRLTDRTHSYSSRGTNVTFVINDHQHQSQGAVPLYLVHGTDSILVFVADNLIDFALVHEETNMAEKKSFSQGQNKALKKSGFVTLRWNSGSRIFFCLLHRLNLFGWL